MADKLGEMDPAITKDTRVWGEISCQKLKDLAVFRSHAFSSSWERYCRLYTYSYAAPDEPELVRLFVNTRDIEAGSDELDSPESLPGWIAGMDLLVEDEPTANEKDLEGALALREGLRSLLLTNHGAEVEPVLINELNRAGGSVCL